MIESRFNINPMVYFAVAPGEYLVIGSMFDVILVFNNSVIKKSM